MDPAANVTEQIEIAKQITAIRDLKTNDRGHISAWDLDEIGSLADRLAELVIALAEWNRLRRT